IVADDFINLARKSRFANDPETELPKTSARPLAISECDGVFRGDILPQGNDEFITVVSISGRDGIFMTSDFTRDRAEKRRQRFRLLSQAPPASDPHAVEPFELCQFDFGCDLFQNLRIAAGNCLDL